MQLLIQFIDFLIPFFGVKEVRVPVVPTMVGFTEEAALNALKSLHKPEQKMVANHIKNNSYVVIEFKCWLFKWDLFKLSRVFSVRTRVGVGTHEPEDKV